MSDSRAGDRQREREVGGRLGQPDAADGRGVDLAVGQLEARAAARAPRAASRPAGCPGRWWPGAGWCSAASPTSACTSVTSARRPSIVTVTQVPATGVAPWARNSPDGSGSPTMPSSRRSKQPTSSAGPKRFFTVRTSRSRECRSPSKDSTTSTRCSSVRGPAIAPSLVTWPTSSVAMPRDLASRIRVLATSRTCATPPAEPSTAAEPMVCTESTIRTSGATASTWPSTAARSVSAAR